MGVLSKITATIAKNFFATPFQRANGVNSLARIDDVNNVIDLVNTLAKDSARRLTYDFFITTSPDNGGIATVERANGGGVYVCQGTCPYVRQDFKEAFCCGASFYYNSVWVNTSITYTATGVYTLTVNPYITIVDPNGGPDTIVNWQDTIVSVGNPSLPGYITVQKNSVSEYIISTFDTAGLPADGIISNTALQITGIPAVNSWSASDH